MNAIKRRKLFALILKLQAMARLTPANQKRLTRLETAWSNLWCRDYPVRR